MKTLKRIEIYKATSDKVFQCLDDLGVTGMHMTESSMPMMGGKLKLEFLTEHHTGLGSKYKWTGKVLGMVMDFTVEVTTWVQNKEKIWETIGTPKLIIYSWYKMHLILTPITDDTHAELSFSYEKPYRWFNKLLSFLLADWYCKWCLKHMLEDCKKSMEENSLRKGGYKEPAIKRQNDA